MGCRRETILVSTPVGISISHSIAVIDKRDKEIIRIVNIVIFEVITIVSHCYHKGSLGCYFTSRLLGIIVYRLTLDPGVRYHVMFNYLASQVVEWESVTNSSSGEGRV